MNWTVEVEWMDGTVKTYQVGGTLPPKEFLFGESDGVLIMWHQDGVSAPRQHVATIPLVNVREYKVYQ